MTIEFILITGAAGFLGNLLARTLAKAHNGAIRVLLTDVVEPNIPLEVESKALKADLTDDRQIRQLFETEFGIPDTIYCLHGVMSRGAEDNFDLGLKINVDSVVALLQTARHYGIQEDKLIKFIFTSSLAVYGGPLPEVITPSTIAVPQGAYGTEKLVSEFYVNEFTRRGFVDGRICRLPTIVVRSGAPAAATSAFLSGIIREPLDGKRAVCPIGNSLDSPDLDLEVWLASPVTTVQNLALARTIEALEIIKGPQILDLIEFKDDETNKRLVSSWPARFDCSYAIGLGFKADSGGMEKVIKDFIQMMEEQ